MFKGLGEIQDPFLIKEKNRWIPTKKTVRINLKEGYLSRIAFLTKGGHDIEKKMLDC